MNFLEKDLEDIIFNSSNNLLQQKNLNINGIKKRQVRIGNYGIADIITISKPPYENIFPGDEEMAHNGEITITIYELKQNKIDANTLMQCFRYKKGVSRYLHKRGFEAKIEVVLIGRVVETNGDFCYLIGAIEGLHVYTYDYLIDGINFVYQDGFFLSNEGF